MQDIAAEELNDRLVKLSWRVKHEKDKSLEIMNGDNLLSSGDRFVTLTSHRLMTKLTRMETAIAEAITASVRLRLAVQYQESNNRNEVIESLLNEE